MIDITSDNNNSYSLLHNTSRLENLAFHSTAVIIVNYNSTKWLKKCLDALIKQTRPPEKVLVIDNASSDFILSEMSKKYPWAEFKVMEKNLGFAEANNVGVSLAGESHWIAFLNPDTEPETTWLENLLKAASHYSHYSFFACKLVMMESPDIIDGTGDIYHLSGRARRRDHGRPSSQVNRPYGEVFTPCAAAALYNRKKFVEVGGFDKDFFCYMEDVDLGFRMRLSGERCLYVPDAVVYHQGSVASGRRSDFYVFHGQRNLLWVFVKNMPWPLFLLFLPCHLFINFGALILFYLKGQGKVALRAKADALRSIPELWKKRKRIQLSRRVNTLYLLKNINKNWRMFLP